MLRTLFYLGTPSILTAGLFVTLAPANAHAQELSCDDFASWTAGTAYKPGQKVTNVGGVYTCKPWPYSGWCGNVGYEPGRSAHWQQAWTFDGACFEEPPYDCSDPSSLPPDWQAGVQYASGDLVLGSDYGVYECKSWPYSGWCGQAPYEPGSGPHWQSAWTLLEHCAILENPDLIVHNLEVFPGDCAPVTVEATIENVSPFTIASPVVSVALYREHPSFGNLLDIVPVDSALLNAGGPIAVDLEWSQGVSGPVNFHVVVDFDNQVPEVDETNNTLSTAQNLFCGG